MLRQLLLSRCNGSMEWRWFLGLGNGWHRWSEAMGGSLGFTGGA